MEFNLADLFESVVDQVGAETAMVSGARRLTYLDLDRRSNRLAHYFEGVGIGPGDHIGIQLVNGTEYIEVMLACFKIRAVPINVNYRYISGELKYIYRDAALAGLVFHSRFAPAVTGALGAMQDTRGMLEVHDGSDPSGIADRLRGGTGVGPGHTWVPSAAVRRSVLRLHRRNDGNAQGGSLAARRYLLRGHGRR